MSVPIIKLTPGGVYLNFFFLATNPHVFTTRHFPSPTKTVLAAFANFCLLTKDLRSRVFSPKAYSSG